MKDQLLKLVQSLPADYVEVRVQESGGTSVQYSGEDLEDIGEKTSRGGCVRALVDGGWGFATFNDLDELERYARRAVEQAALVQGEAFELAPVEPVQDSYTNTGELRTDPREVPLEDKQQLCDRYNRILLGAEDVQTTRVYYRDSTARVWYANSEGTFLDQEYVFCGCSAMAIAVDGPNIQRAYESIGSLEGYEKIVEMDQDVEAVVERVRNVLAARPVEAGTYDVIVDPKLSGVFVHEAFGHLSESDFLYENPRLKEIMQIGKRFGEDILNIVDDGSMERENGYLAYDQEGVPTGRTELIRQGVLTGRLHNRETAAKMGEQPTGNARAISYRHPPIVRMTNTFMEPGESSFEEMLQQTPDGIYARGSVGGQTNMEMFTFTPEEAWRIRDGKLAERVREVVLSGNVFQTLAAIDMIGRDLEMYGGMGGCGKGGQSPLRVGDGGPHCRIRNVNIGGR
jgi:TldD protein